jgi:hypothetical protein
MLSKLSLPSLSVTVLDLILGTVFGAILGAVLVVSFDATLGATFEVVLGGILGIFLGVVVGAMVNGVEKVNLIDVGVGGFLFTHIMQRQEADSRDVGR